MARVRRRFLFLVAVAAVGGCAWQHPPPLLHPQGGGCGGCAWRPPPALHPQVRLGPGANVKAHRVLVLRPGCGSMEFSCPRGYINAVDSIVRNTMDFAGYAVIDPARLRAQTRQRHETHERTLTSRNRERSVKYERTFAPDSRISSQRHSVTRHEHDVVDLDGPGFDDLTPADRAAVLRQAGADAVVTVRIIVGAQTSVWTRNQRVEVLVKLAVDAGDTMAWVSRCSARSHDFATVGAALEHATRCAVRGATGP